MLKIIIMSAFLCNIFFGHKLYGASTQKVTSLNNGSCWIQKSGQGHKMATFGNSQSLYFGEQEKNKILDLLDSDTAFWNFQCSATGGRIVVTMEKYCAWLIVDMNKISLVSYGRKEFAGNASNRPCDGIQPGSLLFKFVGTYKETQSWISSVSGIEDYVESVNQLSKNYYQLIINKEYRFQEPEIRAELELKFLKEERAKYIELDYFLHPIGEFYPLSQ